MGKAALQAVDMGARHSKAGLWAGATQGIENVPCTEIVNSGDWDLGPGGLWQLTHQGKGGLWGVFHDLLINVQCLKC